MRKLQHHQEQDQDQEKPSNPRKPEILDHDTRRTLTPGEGWGRHQAVELLVFSRKPSIRQEGISQFNINSYRRDFKIKAEIIMGFCCQFYWNLLNTNCDHFRTCQYCAGGQYKYRNSSHVFRTDAGTPKQSEHRKEKQRIHKIRDGNLTKFRHLQIISCRQETLVDYKSCGIFL